MCIGNDENVLKDSIEASLEGGRPVVQRPGKPCQPALSWSFIRLFSNHNYYFLRHHACHSCRCNCFLLLTAALHTASYTTRLYLPPPDRMSIQVSPSEFSTPYSCGIICCYATSLARWGYRNDLFWHLQFSIIPAESDRTADWRNMFSKCRRRRKLVTSGGPDSSNPNRVFQQR